MKQRTDKSDINEEYNISIFRNGGLPRLPELVKHDDSDTIKEVISACIGIMCYTPGITNSYLSGSIYFKMSLTFTYYTIAMVSALQLSTYNCSQLS